jgi:hypothetical protein
MATQVDALIPRALTVTGSVGEAVDEVDEPSQHAGPYKRNHLKPAQAAVQACYCS